MGQKSNPIILRLNKTNQHWNSCWYSDYDYATPFIEDCKINPYINSSQQQLERFPPVSFVKRQRGDLQVALFSAKPAQQFSKFKHNKYKKETGCLVTHGIFKKWANYEKPIHKLLIPQDGVHAMANAPSTFSKLKKKECFRRGIFLAMGSKYNAWGLVSDCGVKSESFRYMLSRKIPALFPGEMESPFLSAHESINSASEKGGRASLKMVSPLRNHLEYSIYKYYNEYNAPSTTKMNLRPVRSKLYLVKSPSIYQNPLFLASQVVYLLEERAVFRQIKHRVVREIRKNPIIKGVRIICSGRVASRSKKAQKARRESIQWGATSLNVFSEHVNFASCFAQTAFGKIGVKVWISYNSVASLHQRCTMHSKLAH